MILECAVFCVVLVAFKRHMFVGSLTTLRFLLHPCLCFFFKKKFNVCRSSFGLRDSISLDVLAAQHSYQTFFFSCSVLLVRASDSEELSVLFLGTVC